MFNVIWKMCYETHLEAELYDMSNHQNSFLFSGILFGESLSGFLEKNGYKTPGLSISLDKILHN